MSRKRRLRHKGASDFHDGKPVDHLQILDWRIDIINALERGKKFSVISSGNSMVIGFRIGDECQVIEVTNGYKEHTYTAKKVKDE